MGGQPPQGSSQMRSQSQDKSKLAFKSRLDQKAVQIAQDDSQLSQNPSQVANMAPKNVQPNFQKRVTNPKNPKIQVKLPKTGIE